MFVRDRTYSEKEWRDMRSYEEVKISIVQWVESDIVRTSIESGTVEDNYDWLD
jgi:hypothetical protein